MLALGEVLGDLFSEVVVLAGLDDLGGHYISTGSPVSLGLAEGFLGFLETVLGSLDILEVFGARAYWDERERGYWGCSSY